MKKYKSLFFGFLLVTVINSIFSKSVLLNSGSNSFFFQERFISLYNSLIHWDFFPTINELANGGLGYPTPLFYNNWYLYPFALLKGFNLSNEMITLIFVWLLNYLTGLVIYMVGRKYTTHDLKIFFVTLIFIINPYRIFLILKTARYPELLAQTIVIVVFYFFIESLYKNDRKYYIGLVISLFLLTITHNITTLLTIIALIILFAVNYKRITKEIFINFFKYGLLFIGCASFYIFPIIEQQKFQSLFVESNPLNKLSDSYKEITLVQSLINSIFQFQMVETINIFFIIFFIIILFKNRELKPLSITIFIMFLLELVFFNFKFFDDTFINVIQFHTRFYSVICPLISILILQNKFNFKMKRVYLQTLVGFYFIASMFILVFYVDLNNSNINRKQLSDTELTYQVGTGYEYAPISLSNYINVQADSFDSNILKIKKLNNIKYLNNHGKYKLKDKYNELDIDYEDSDGIITVPIMNYKGYVAEVDGIEVPINTSDYGLVKVDTGKKSGNLTIEYRKTLVQKISGILSILSFIFMYLILYKNRKKT